MPLSEDPLPPPLVQAWHEMLEVSGSVSQTTEPKEPSPIPVSSHTHSESDAPRSSLEGSVKGQCV